MSEREILDYVIDDSVELYPLNELNPTDIEQIKKINSNIRINELYQYKFHGLFHSQRVMLFAYLIGKKVNLSDEDMKIILDAAVYHDIGRENDFEDTTHGYSSALKFDRLFKNDEFYNDENNLKLLKAICDGHSRPDKDKKNTFDNSDMDVSLYDRYDKLYKILKDSDALDRARFPKSAPESIKEEFLRLDYSKSIVEFAFYLNKSFSRYLDNIHYSSYSEKYRSEEKEKACLHGIGWDFGKLESILDNGILSNYAANNQDVVISRNFEGNNSNMWISVVDSKNVSLEAEAYQEFANNNICFYSFVSGYHDGEKNKSKALSEGLPIKSGLYSDESFVFDQIAPNDIGYLILPKNASNKRLDELDYLHCCNGYKTVRDRVGYYFDYIKKTCDLEPDTSKTDILIEKLKTMQIEFGKQIELYQKQNLNSFLNECNLLVSIINNEICKNMNNSFKQYFNLDVDENPTVGMVIKDILKRKNINHEIYDSSDEVLIKLDLEKKNDLGIKKGS